uniref:Ras domain containing protein n=1 Tax=Haemonchus contortus TaxID=6289 RepID=A0A7I4YSQ8_HAECO
MDKKKLLKLVVVGDSYVGKTTLLFAYTERQFRSVYSTTVFDNWAMTVEIDNSNYTVNLFDTAGQEDYVHLRCLSYPNTDVFLLCFSLVDPKSLDVCQTVWLPEIRKYAGDNVPVLLIGTKEDLMDSSHEKQRVTFDTARRAAHEMGCIKFLPCSALTHRGLKQVFDEALLVAIGVNVKEDFRRPCCIML